MSVTASIFAGLEDAPQPDAQAVTGGALLPADLRFKGARAGMLLGIEQVDPRASLRPVPPPASSGGGGSSQPPGGGTGMMAVLGQQLQRRRASIADEEEVEEMKLALYAPPTWDPPKGGPAAAAARIRRGTVFPNALMPVSEEDEDNDEDDDDDAVDQFLFGENGSNAAEPEAPMGCKLVPPPAAAPASAPTLPLQRVRVRIMPTPAPVGSKGGLSTGLQLQVDAGAAKRVWVRAVDPHSVAGRGGQVRVGDTVLEINGLSAADHPIEVLSRALEDVANSGGGAPVEMVLLRKKSRFAAAAPPPMADVGSFMDGGGGTGAGGASTALIITVHSAEELYDCQLLGSMDPYVVVDSMPSRLATARTSPHNSGGTNPTWSHADGATMLVPLSNADDGALLEVWNDNTFRDDLIGRLELFLDDDRIILGKNSRFELQRGSDGAPAGFLHATVSIFRPQQALAMALVAAPAATSTASFAAGGAVVVEVIRAADLKDAQWMGSMDPYVTAKVLPSCRAKGATRFSHGGGTAPQWTAEHANSLFLSIARAGGDRIADTEVALELWNANLLSDDLIGKARIALPIITLPPDQLLPTGGGLASYGNGIVRRHARIPVDTGGSIECIITQMDRVRDPTETNAQAAATLPTAAPPPPPPSSHVAPAAVKAAPSAAAPADDAQQQVPQKGMEHIDVRFDPTYNLSYFFNTQTGVSGWSLEEVLGEENDPLLKQLTDDIEVRFDRRQNCAYFRSISTALTGWELEPLQEAIAKISPPAHNAPPAAAAAAAPGANGDDEDEEEVARQAMQAALSRAAEARARADAEAAAAQAEAEAIAAAARGRAEAAVTKSLLKQRGGGAVRKESVMNAMASAGASWAKPAASIPELEAAGAKRSVSFGAESQSEPPSLVAASADPAPVRAAHPLAAAAAAAAATGGHLAPATSQLPPPPPPPSAGSNVAGAGGVAQMAAIEAQKRAARAASGESPAAPPRAPAAPQAPTMAEQAVALAEARRARQGAVQGTGDPQIAKPTVAAWLAERKLPCDDATVGNLLAVGVAEVSDLALLVSL
jgi:uncharacterized protein YciI